MAGPKAEQEKIAQLVAAAEGSGETDNYAGKRQALRVTDGVPLEFTEDPSRPAAAVPVTMHNVSGGGCAFWLRRKLELHARVFIREFTPDNSAPWVQAYVTHCTQGLRGFLIGAAFGEPESN